MDRILVLRGGALGDFIVTLPALALVRERWPRAHIELAGNAKAGQLALERGLIDAIHSQHDARWAGLFGDGPLATDFAAWLASFDLVLNFWPDDDGELSRRFPLRDRQQFISAPAMPQCAPAAAHYCEPLRKLGIIPRENFFRLTPLTSEMMGVNAGMVPAPTQRATCNGNSARIAIHPGSGSPRKNWPAESWQRLIEKLSAPVALILGEPELERFEVGPALGAVPSHSSVPRHADKRQPYFETSPLRESAPSNVLQLINRPLEELVDHLSQCRLFLGHDSGISHLAAACGVRCVLLFGPTNPAVWAPPAPNVRVLRSNLESLSVDAVWHVVAEELADRK